MGQAAGPYDVQAQVKLIATNMHFFLSLVKSSCGPNHSRA